jgi:hypothetical protein
MPPTSFRAGLDLGARVSLRRTCLDGGLEPVAHRPQIGVVQRMAVAEQALEQRLGHRHQGFGILQIVAVELDQHIDLDDIITP